MENNLIKITEELRSLMEDDLTEDELVDDFGGDVDMKDTTFEPVDETPTLSLTDELDAKARISRGLDFLKAAIDSFKSATMTEIDLIKDANISSAMENLDQAVSTITSALGGKLEEDISTQIGMDLQNDAETSEDETEQETEDEEVEETEEEDTDSDEEDETDEEDEKSDEEEEEESDFDEEAEFDLFK